jgi:dTDP-4-amino-4,6-dideoxygalactose transaminase
MKIPFNLSNSNPKALEYINQALLSGNIVGDGSFTKECHNLLKNFTLAKGELLLTQSCTVAMEMVAVLLDLSVGDEIIMPSFTFVSTANPFVLRGAVPVFVDIRPDNCNIDEDLIVDAITSKTKAVVVVHYAGVACNMDKIKKICQQHNLTLIEDAAQAFGAYYVNSSNQKQHLGTIGDLGAISFHGTKNIVSGEGGVLLVNNLHYLDRATIIREKGTNRSNFIKGLVDKYTWVDIGSSYLPSDVTAALLKANLEIANEITQKRLHLWQYYYENLKSLVPKIVLPTVNDFATNNAHIFYLLLPNEEMRDLFIDKMKEAGISTAFHYIPLHSSPAGVKFGKASGNFDNTNRIAKTLVRLPLYYDLMLEEAEFVVHQAIKIIKQL